MEFQPGDKVHYFAHGTRTVLKGLHEGLGGMGYVVSDPTARSRGRWVHEREVSSLADRKAEIMEAGWQKGPGFDEGALSAHRAEVLARMAKESAE